MSTRETLALERPQEQDRSPVKVPLTQGFFATIDKEDAERVLAFKWCVSVNKRKRVPNAYSAVRRENRKTVLLHRFILSAPSELDVDHKDNDGLNCRRSNLRLATRAQNNSNKSQVNSTKPYKGVYYDPRRKHPYYAQVMKDYKTHNLCGFDAAEEAARAYDAKALELFGEFARLNFPQTAEQGALC